MKRLAKPTVLLALIATLFSISVSNASSIGSFKEGQNLPRECESNLLVGPTTEVAQVVGWAAAGVAAAYFAGTYIGEFVYNISHSGQNQLATLLPSQTAETATDFSQFDI